MPLLLIVPVDCPKTLTAPSKFFRVWAVAERHADEVERRIKRRKEKDLRTEGMHISLPTLLHLKEMERGTTSSFNPKR
jgi:hypothetical protein